MISKRTSTAFLGWRFALDKASLLHLEQHRLVVSHRVRTSDVVEIINLLSCERLPGKISKQHLLEIIQGPIEFEQPWVNGRSWTITKGGDSLMLLRASFRHDVLHDSVAHRVFSRKYQVMACTNTSIIFEAERKHILCSQFAHGFAQCLNYGRLSFPWWQTCNFFPQPLCAIQPKQSIHVPFHRLVTQPGIDAVVVEEEYAVTPPILEERVYKVER